MFSVAVYGLTKNDGMNEDAELAGASEVHRHPIYGVAFSADGRMFATFGRDEDVTLYETESGKPIAWLESSVSAPSAIAYSADGDRLVAGYYDYRVMLWVDLLSEPRPILLGESRSHLRSLALSCDGTVLASGDVEGNLIFWDMEGGGKRAVISTQQAGIHALAISPDATVVLTGGADGSCSLRLVATGSELQRFLGHAGLVNAVAISPDGRFAASTGLDCTIRVWDVASGREMWRGQADLYSGRTVEFSRDGRFVASGGVDKTVKLWDAQSGRLVATFRGHDKGISRVRFLPRSDHRVVSAGYDGTIRFWDSDTGQQTRHIFGE